MIKATSIHNVNLHWYIFLGLMLILSSCVPNIRYSSKIRPVITKDKSVDLLDLDPKDNAYIQSKKFQPILGKASYYGDKFEGKLTASGEIYNKNMLTAAHKTLPFGVNVKVRNLSNNREVVVRINDRGPFVAGRIIDLSYRAAMELGMIRDGVVDVEIIPIVFRGEDLKDSPYWEYLLDQDDDD